MKYYHETNVAVNKIPKQVNHLNIFGLIDKLTFLVNALTNTDEKRAENKQLFIKVQDIFIHLYSEHVAFMWLLSTQK